MGYRTSVLSFNFPVNLKFLIKTIEVIKMYLGKLRMVFKRMLEVTSTRNKRQTTHSSITQQYVNFLKLPFMESDDSFKCVYA